MKRILTYTGCLVFSLAILWGCMFGADCYQAANLKRPLFALCHMTADDGGSGTYKGLGYTVDIEGELTTEYGFVVEKAEVTFCDKVVVASIT